MGISGLLPLLKPVTTQVHVSELRGLRIGVDAYVWLHKGAFGCAPDLCQGRPTKRYLNHCIERLNLLLHAGAHVYLVFDGGPLPAKKGTEEERRARREESRRKALQCLAEGKSGDAFVHFSKAVDVTPAFAKEWINTLKGAPNVNYVVAPYEADAQLAFLCRVGMLDAVITEDSDILAFGCPRVLFKLDQDGTAQQILHADLFEAPIEGLGDMRAWDEDTFLHMCIISGCDYLPSVPGVGLRSAFRLFQRHGTADKALRALRLQQFGKGRAASQVPPDYEVRFQKAYLTFRHQRVFDPRTQEMAHVHPLPPDLAALPPSELEFLGPPIEAAVAARVAIGELDPITFEPFPQPSAADAALPVGPMVAVTTAAAQPRISDYLKKLPARPLAPVRAIEAEEEQEEEEQDVESSSSSGKARPVPIYRPSLPKQQHGSRVGVGGYLRRTAAALADATVHATAGLLPRKRPAPTPAAATSSAAIAAETGGAEEQAGAVGCLPQVSSWFSSNSSSSSSSKKGNAKCSGKENAMPAPVSGSYALPSKRPRTLGASARPAAFGLRRLAAVGGKGEEQEKEEEQEGEGRDGGRGKSPFTGDESDGGGGGYEDSLQPPTPGTPFVAPPQSPPDDDDDEEQHGAVGGAGGKSNTSTSIFREFSFEPPQQEAQPAGAGGGGTGEVPLAALAPNTMTPRARQAQQQQEGQQQQRRRQASVVEGKAAATTAWTAGAADGPAACGGNARTHSTPVSMASFSFEAFEFSSASAGPL